MMMYLCFILRFFFAQGINLSVQDLYDSSWSVQGWSTITAGGSTSSYNTITTQCNNQNMLKLTDAYLTYQKTYTILDQEFYKLYIDFEVYFYLFTQTSINILVNSNLVYSQSFTNSILTLNNICNTGSDSQFIIFQEFYTSQSTLLIQIQYIKNIPNSNSFIGIKNLNLYSNGIPLIGGCPMNMPLQSQGTCVTQCTTTQPYLTGEYFTQCAAGFNTSYGQIRYYQTTVANFAISNSPPNATVSAYFDGSYKLINSNVYTSSIFHSNLFTNQFQSASPIYQANFNAQGIDKLQFYFTFYVFGTWDEGSFVKIYIGGASIYKNNMVSISKTYGKLISSTQSIFYDTNVTQNGVQQVAKKTLISFSAHYYGSPQVQFCFTQVLQGSTASYGFGDILFYKAAQDANFNFPANTDIYGLPYTCINGLYAYNGTCVTTCPIFSFTSNANYNCTDYSISESSIYNPAISISSNAYGSYIIKLFYQNNFQQSDIDSLFQITPPSSKNYLNSESFSFIKSKKILGGYNSWGYGTYQASFSNLIAHFQVRFFFTLYLIDGWQIGDTFTYQVDGTVVGTFTSNPSLQYQGLSTLDTIHVISARKVNHGSSTLSISFNCNIAQKDSSKASCGIQNLFVLLDQNINILCPLNNQFFSYTTQNCETCTTTSCQLFPSNGITAKCSIGCLTCTSSSICSVCDTSNGYQLSGNACICLSNYIMVSSICQKCHYQCTTCSGIAYNQCNTCDATRTISINTCSCNLNYQDVYSQTSCASITPTCHYSCSMCFGLQYYQCLLCPSSSFRSYQSSSNTCPCDAGYSDNGVAICIPPYTCDVSCLTCSAAGSTNCLSCDSNKNRTNLSSGSCPCDSGYNDNLNPGHGCVANYNSCHYSCQTCYGASNTNCLTCSSANFRTISSNSCPCNSEYIDITIAICAFNYTPCIYSCLTCFGATETQCLTCPTTRNLNIATIGINQSCICQDGTYNNSVATCVACDSTCKTCTAPGSNSCSSCDPSKNRTQTGTTCPCSAGYNDILSPGNTCVVNYTPCHYSCLTCYQSSSNNCLSCTNSNHRIFQSATKICKCDTNYSEIGVAACLINYTPCHNNCLTCYGPASNQCSTCVVGRIINTVSIGVESTCPCDASYYASGLQCLSCHPLCLSCNGSSSNHCTDCDASAFRQLIGSECQCFLAFNELLNPGICVNDYMPCHSSCQTCFGPSNNQCITCNTNRTLITNSCPCSTGYNEIVNSGTCILNHSPCNSQCASCYGGLNNNCISCNSNNKRTFDSNTNTCPCNINYIDIGQVLCVQLYNPCYSSCSTCFGDQIYQCLTCPPTRTLNQVSPGNQSCDCSPRYYEISGASQCSPCDYTCASCNGGTNLNCQTCYANRILTSGACPCISNYNDLKGTLNDCQLNYSPCHLSCFTCFGGNNNQCLDCQLASLRTYNNTTNTCDCLSGYDGSQTVCTYICHNTCLTCNGPSQTDCLTCNTAVRLLSGTSCLCNNGTNDKLIPPTCSVDLTSCYADYILACFGNSKNQALRCDSILKRILDNNICNCSVGYFEDASNGNACSICHYSCLTCQTTQQNCLTCSIQKFRQISSNSCPCIQNYKEVNQNCITCTNTDCLICDNQQNCLTCVSQIKQVSNGLCICIDGYYQQGNNCNQCDANCLTCNGASNTNCLSCDISVYRIINFRQCVCMTGYQENSNGQCIDCQSEEGILIFQCQYKNSQDGVWTYGEQCDDGNNDPRDGCDNQTLEKNFSCTNIINQPSICYKCPDNCAKCMYVDDQLECNSCLDTFYNSKYSCIKCADSQCQYCITPSNCSVCINEIIPQNGKCVYCQRGFYQLEQICQSECGDGFKTENEGCDDGNLLSGDGCSNQCQVEENFVCQTTSNISSCKINPPPKLNINQVSTLTSTNIYQFQIKSDQSIFQNDIRLMDFQNETQFILEYLIHNESHFTTLLIDVNVTFLKSFDDIDLIFYVQGQIYNEYNQNLSNRYLVTKITNIQVMNQQETQISSQVSKMGEGMLITFASFSLFQLLLGGVQQFVQFLNMIQKLQYIKYINIDFPPNLNQFLQIFNRFSLQPFLQFAQINNILELFGDEEIPYVQPSAKFQENDINAYFLQNIQDYFLTLLSGLLINCIFQIIVKLLEDLKSKFGQRQFFLMKQLYNIVQKSQRFLINSIQFSQNYGFIQLTVLSCFDIQFAILIQLSTQNYDDTNLAINCILAYGFMLFFIIIIIKCLSFRDDEINNKIIWQSSFCSIRMIESVIFMFSIVNLQNFPQCQVIIISLSSFSISFYIFTFKPLKASLNNYKLIIQEFALFVTNISFVGYIYFPTEINQINLGWFQIASYGSMIIANLAIELYSNAKTIRTMCSQQQNRTYESPRLLI